ncbi:hypothetical protein [Sphingomonas agri]|uniref:hypothetical protein n=1 Tax=Sphingomonas agri TaxID=1813878 RepID=UPI00311E08D1
MADVTFAVMSILTAVGLLLVVLKPVPISTGRAFIYAGAATLCAHAIGVKIVAPIPEAAADKLSWVTLFGMAAMIFLVAGRGLVRTVRKDNPAASGMAN